MILNFRFVRQKNRIQAFTLVEILVAIAILGVLSTFGYAISINFYKSYVFTEERDTVVSLLQTARAQSLANINQSPHGVHFDSSQYVLFQGLSYGTRNSAYDEIFPAASGIGNSGLVDVVFNRLTAETSGPATLTLADGQHTANITLNSEGQIDW